MEEKGRGGRAEEGSVRKRPSLRLERQRRATQRAMRLGCRQAKPLGALPRNDGVTMWKRLSHQGSCFCLRRLIRPSRRPRRPRHLRRSRASLLHLLQLRHRCLFRTRASHVLRLLQRHRRHHRRCRSRANRERLSPSLRRRLSQSPRSRSRSRDVQLQPRPTTTTTITTTEPAFGIALATADGRASRCFSAGRTR
jgi:hypothetical protein